MKEYTYSWYNAVDPYTREVQKSRKWESDNKEIQKSIDRAEIVVFHNAKFDIRALSKRGIVVPWDKVHDTQLLSHAVDSDPSDHYHALKPLALKYLDILDDDEKALKVQVQRAHTIINRSPDTYGEWRTIRTDDGKDWDGYSDYFLPSLLWPEDESLETYGDRDAVRTLRLFFLFMSSLHREEGQHQLDQYLQNRLQLEFSYNMEERGIRLLSNTTRTLRADMEKRRDTALTTLKRLSKRKDFNPQSPIQVSTLCNSLGIVTYVKTKKGNVSYGADALEEVEDKYKGPQRRAIDCLKSFRTHAAAANSCTAYEDYAKTEEGIKVIHPTYKIHGTATTRYSSENPNGHNIKKHGEPNLRALFGPRQGYLWYDNDFANIELRLFAWEAGEKELIKAFESGVSVHLVIARILYGDHITKDSPEYAPTKNGNFALIYGAKEEKADLTYGKTGAYQRIRKMLPKIPAYTNRMGELARKYGYVHTLLGYRLSVPRNIPHKAVSYRIQGSAGQVLKLGTLAVDNLLSSRKNVDARTLITVHDQLVTEVLTIHDTPALRKEVKQALESPGQLISIPTPVEFNIVTKRWSEGKEVKV